MRIFDILGLYTDELSPRATKVHFAVNNGRVDPLDVFLAGDFESWQAQQSK